MNQTLSASVSTQRSNSPDLKLEDRLKKVIEAGPAAIQDRLQELDGEWSIGRMIKVAIAGLIGLGFVLAWALDPLWLILAGLGGLCLAQYLIAPKSWLGAIISQFGFRSGTDIEHEKLALRTLRGDFQHLPTIHDVEDRDAVSRLEGEGGIAVDTVDTKRHMDDVVKEVLEVTQQ